MYLKYQDENAGTHHKLKICIQNSENRRSTRNWWPIPNFEKVTLDIVLLNILCKLLQSPCKGLVMYFFHVLVKSAWIVAGVVTKLAGVSNAIVDSFKVCLQCTVLDKFFRADRAFVLHP